MNRVGEVNYNNQGEKIIIIAYRNTKDIDIQFEDGVIVYHRTYDNFKIGRMEHPIRYEESFAYHIEVELGLNLDDIWNWDKNNELGINPYETYKNSDKKIWLYCLEHDYHNYNKEGNKIGYQTTCANFYNNQRCGYCHKGRGRSKVHWKDSLAYNYPQVVKMIAIEENNLTFEDCYNIACQSNKKFYFKCLDCEKVSNKKYALSNIINQGFSCKYCSDGISIPNKFMGNLLNQLNIKFEPEYSPYYFRNKQHVDFLLIDYNIVIEMDGNYGNHTKEYDYWRDFPNMKYGGYKTIRIDLTNDKYNIDKFNYIKKQILKSELYTLINLNNIDWELIWEQCQKSKCIEAWELWNNGMHDVVKICKILNIKYPTLYNYLKRGTECGKCNYTKYESKRVGYNKNKGENHHNSIKVICVTTGDIFDTLTEAERKYGLCRGSLNQYFKNKGSYCGKLSDGTKLIWNKIIN